jgi:hypothetical protein
MKQLIINRFFLGGVFLILGSICLYEAYTADIIFSTDALGAMDYPKVLLFAWLALTVTYIVIPRPRFDPTELMVAAPVLIKTIFNSVIFVLFLPRFGFLCSSFIFVSALFYILGDRNYRKIGLISFASVVGLWVIFEFVLRTPLPLGFWEEILHSS